MGDRFTTLISFVIGIVPTFGLLFVLTSRFERYLEEKDTMTSFIIGLFVGIPLAISHMYFSFSYDPDMPELYLGVVLLAPVEVLAYQIYLNRKKFRDRKDLPFIALGFCLGAAATYIGFLTGWRFWSMEADLGTVLGTVLFALGLGPFKAAVAIILSRGEVKKVVRPAMFHAILALVGLNVFLFSYMYSFFIWTFALPIAALGLVLFYMQFKGFSKELRARR